MSERVDRELDELLCVAERRGTCLVPGEERHAVALRRRAPAVVSPARGMYARAQWWDGLEASGRAFALMRGLQELHPDWVFCGPSAALAHGADVSWPMLGRVHVAVSSHGRRSTELVARHVTDVSDAVVRSGVRVTSLARTALDCLSAMDFREGMVVADRVAREGPRYLEWLREWMECQRGRRRGVGRALGTLAHADARAESGGESIARAVMIEQGFMLPALQVWVPDPLTPGSWFRVDFLWALADGRVIIGELDGAAKSGDPRMARGRSRDEVLLAERRREALLTAYDVSIVRFSYAEAAGVTELVRKLELYGVPRASSSLARHGEPPAIDWAALRRRSSCPSRQSVV